jgi:hypothetical protein
MAEHSDRDEAETSVQANTAMMMIRNLEIIEPSSVF